MELKRNSSVEADIAWKKLKSLLHNPYAIERRERKLKEEREYVQRAWNNKTIGGKRK